MSQRHDYPSGIPCWVDTLQHDVDRALEFYRGVFGWTMTGPGKMPGNPPGRYYVAQLHGDDVAGIGSQPSGPETPAAWTQYVAVSSCEQALEPVARTGGKVLVPPTDVPPAGRVAVISDPEGAVIGLWEARARLGAKRVNEPGAWAMSALNTPDPQGARAFYRAVFGWQAEDIDLGGTEMTLWRVPGYVGGVAEQPVPRDMVAVMMPSMDQDPSPHWSINFWIDDADAAARKVGDLGGRVVVPPYDANGFRQAVITDPEGARFTVAAMLKR
jgi:predicted enzyme related to lactoylglutathione lyase